MLDNVNLYTILKYLHILLAIVAVGFNASYGVWIARARRRPEDLSATLRGIKVLDDWFANPSYLLLFVTGLAMVFAGRIPHTTFWIAASIVLWLVALVLGYGLYTPTLRKQIRVLEAEGPGSSELARLSKRGTILGAVLGVDVLIIVALMVFKPTLT